MRYLDSFIYNSEESGNSRLYEFLATNYDISNLANKIYAAKNAKMNILSLKKIGNITNI